MTVYRFLSFLFLVWKIIWNRTIQIAVIAVVGRIEKWLWNVVRMELQPTSTYSGSPPPPRFARHPLATAMVMYVSAWLRVTVTVVTTAEFDSVRLLWVTDSGGGKGTWNAWPLKKRPETSVTRYQSTLRNIPEELGCHLHRDGCLKSLTETWSWTDACNAKKNNSWFVIT
jgi:hypothetical protein